MSQRTEEKGYKKEEEGARTVMVFSSQPALLYPDSRRWPSQVVDHGAGRGGGDDHIRRQLPSAAAPRAESSLPAGATRSPSSMTERARLARIPPPEPAALKCPRCDSSNTKFCYFNNYSFSQPRHFCKTCRRYWTRGGALRNVPVGGGCRRNKRSKGSGRSKSTAAGGTAGADRRSGNIDDATATAAAAAAGGAVALNMDPHLSDQLPFMAPLLPWAADRCAAAAPDTGLDFTGRFHLGGDGSTIAGSEQYWMLHHAQRFPLLTGLEPPTMPPSMEIFPFLGEAAADGGVGDFAGRVDGKPTASGGLTSQPAAVKLEGNPQGAATLLGQYQDSIPRYADHYWSSAGAGVWADLSGSFISSSTSSMLYSFAAQ